MEGMTLPDTSAICAAFDLGAPIAAMTPVSGGLSNRMWRLRTDRGEFAVKELNRDFDNADYMPWFERAFAVEMAAFNAGIPMPRPIPAARTGGCLAELPAVGERPATVRVHEWVDGIPVSGADADTATARQVGVILARVHALRLPTEATLAEMLLVHGDAHWHSLVERLRAADVPWASRLEAVLSTISELEAFVLEAGAEPVNLIMSHRDADQKNVILARDADANSVAQASSPARLPEAMLIDWDAAGPVSARHEIAKEALDWAGVHRGEPDPSVASGMIDGYRAAGGDFGSARRNDFGEFIGVILIWLEFNVRRALGERLQDVSDAELATREALQILENLPRFATSLDKWVALLS